MKKTYQISRRRAAEKFRKFALAHPTPIQLTFPLAEVVVVEKVNPSSRAAEAGLERGDVIQQVNHKPVTNVKEFNRAVGDSTKEAPVLLFVKRNGSTTFLAV